MEVFFRFWVFLILAGAGCAFGVVGCQEKPREFEDFEEAMQEGWEDFNILEFDRAAEAFTSGLEFVCDEEDRAEVSYALGTLWNLRRPGNHPRRAEAAYRQAIKLAPDSDWAAWSDFALVQVLRATMIEELPDLAVLEPRYREVIRKYPSHAVAQEAFLCLQNARLVRGYTPEVETALREMTEWREQMPKDSPYRWALISLLADGHFMLGQGKEALPYYLILLPDSEEKKADEVAADKRRQQISAAPIPAKTNKRGTTKKTPPVTTKKPANTTGTENESFREMSLEEQKLLRPQGDSSVAYYRAGTIAQFDVGDFALARQLYAKMIEEYPNDQKCFLVEQHLAAMETFETVLKDDLKKEGSKK